MIAMTTSNSISVKPCRSRVFMSTPSRTERMDGVAQRKSRRAHDATWEDIAPSGACIPPGSDHCEALVPCDDGGSQKALHVWMTLRPERLLLSDARPDRNKIPRFRQGF